MTYCSIENAYKAMREAQDKLYNLEDEDIHNLSQEETKYFIFMYELLGEMREEFRRDYEELNK